ncbi:hypothetical protein ONZ43_g100 [Nemania bipapillata]|uniref:Uncharacterized protein n=1 Tax=Nemania bipapillata TaxID=110536 RepID=A0ACC2J9I3_9PEZI|nr:hypothetical protein ONZ43_g100 [Nemania bipapillata]
MYNNAPRSDAMVRGTCVDNARPCLHQDMSMHDVMGKLGVAMDDPATDNQPFAENGAGNSKPLADPKVIRRKLYFLVAAHKTVEVGKEFVAVARITHSKTREERNMFVNAHARAYHYTPEMSHRQFNTSTPLTPGELAGATCNDQAFVVHKAVGTSGAPAGTYLVYRLKRTEPGTRNLRFEATWDWGNGITGTASYDFVALTARDDYISREYTPGQRNLLNILWPEWENYTEC